MSDSDIIIDGLRFSTTKDASTHFGISANYITRFCREGFVRGTRVGGIWYVDIESLKAFIATQEEKKREWKEKLVEKRQRERAQAHVQPLPKFIVAPHTLHHHTQARLAAERAAAERTIAIAALGLMLFLGSLGVAFSGIAPVIAQRAASVASIADVGSAIVQRFTSFFDSLFARNEYEIPPAWEKTIVTPKATSTIVQTAQPVVVASNAPTQTIVNQPVIERTHTIYQGGVSEQLLDSRLTTFEEELDRRLALLDYQQSRQADELSLDIAGIGGGGFDDIDITNSTWTGGSIAGASISGGSLSGTTLSLSGDATLTNLTATNATTTSATSTNFYVSGSLGFGSGTGIVHTTSGIASTLANGSNGQVLKIVGGTLSWSTDLSGGAGGGGVWATTTDDLAIYPVDTTDVVILGDSATTTTGNILEVAGNSLFRGTAISYGLLTAPRFTATSSIASVFPYASTTVLSATTLCLAGDTCRTTWPTDGFSTTSSDYWKSVNNFFSTTSADYWETQQTARTADDLTNNSIEDLNDVAAMTENYGDLLFWNGTSWADIATSSLGLVTASDLGAYFTLSAWYATTTDGLDEGSTNRYYTDSRVQTYLDTIGKGYFFSTTSADAWKDQRNFFSTTSSDYWKSVNNFFSTTSADYYVHSSTTIPKTYTNNTFASLQTFANASSTLFSSSYASSTNLYAHTICLTADTCRTTWPTAGSSFDYPFPNNATSTTLTFSNGLLITASTTITGNATTTGMLGVGSLFINNERFTDLTGTGLTNTAGALTLDATGNWTGTFDGLEGSFYLANSFSTTSANYWSSLGLGFSTTSADVWKTERNFFSTTSADFWKTANNFFSTTSAIYFVDASTTIPKTYTANTFSMLQTFTNASSTLFSSVYASSTNAYFSRVGIGTSTPQSALTVTSGSDGTLNFPAGNWAAQIYNQDDNVTSGGLVVGNRWYSDTSKVFEVGSLFGDGTAWESFLTVTGQGSVGIGTSTPNIQGLQIHKGVPTIQLSNTTTGSESLDGFLISLTANDASLSNREAGNITFSTNGGTERLRITSGGNIGIGTTSPYTKLSIAGETVASHFTATTTATSSLPALSVPTSFNLFGTFANSLDDLCVGITGGSGLCDGVDNTGGGSGLATSTDIADTWIIYGTSANDVGAESAFTYDDATNLLTVPYASTTALSATSLCLSTDCRTAWPTFTDTSFSTTSADFWKTVNNFFSTTSADYYVHSSTTIPKTYTNNTFAGLQTFANASSTLFSSVYASTTNLFAGTATLGSLDLSSALAVAEGGTGASSFSYGLLLSPGGTTALTNIATSSLGLLTTHVAEGSNLYYTDNRVQTYLDSVNKGFFFSTTSADAWKDQRNFFSTTSADYWGSTKGYATFGYLFPNNATTTNLMLLASTTIGNGTQAGGLTISGGATTTGFLKVLGTATSTFAAGVNLDSGCFSIGGLCLPFRTDTWNNVYTASQGALASNSSGVGNFAAGFNAMRLNQSASSNIAIGERSLYNNDSSGNILANGNIALGVEALFSNVDGEGNIAQGEDALYSNNTGNFNIAIGKNALFDNVSGTINVAIGATALTNSTGSRNVGIGDSAGSNLVSGNNNIFIGYDTSAVSTSASDQLNIGNLLYGNTSSKLFGIGTTSPYRQLSVGGSAVFGGNVLAANFTATSSVASTFPYASTTALSATTLCLSTDCRTSWPTALTAYDAWTHPSSGVSATTSGIIISASSTIGNSTQAGGLTISGGATTTGSQYIAGSLGVGTTSPLAKLTIKGSGFSTGKSFLITDSTNAPVFTVQDNAYAGVGTSTPPTPLYVYTASTIADSPSLSAYRGIASFATDRSGSELSIGGYVTTPYGIWLQAKDVFNDGGSRPLLLNPLGGSVGVGTNDPNTEFEVVGTASTSALMVSGDFTLASAQGNAGCATFSLGGVLSSTGSACSGSSFSYPFPAGATSSPLMLLASTTIGNGSQAGGLTISGGATTTGNAYFAGNVGIGTATATQKFHISGGNMLLANGGDTKFFVGDTSNYLQMNGDLQAQAANSMRFNAVGGAVFFINNSGAKFQVGGTGESDTDLLLTNDGKLGIGMTSPSSVLSFAGTSGLFASTTATSTFQGGGINLITAAGNTGCFAVNGTCLSSGSSLTGTTGQLAYFSGTNTAVGTSTLFIDTNGRVGVGTTSMYGYGPNYGAFINSKMRIDVSDASTTGTHAGLYVGGTQTVAKPGLDGVVAGAIFEPRFAPSAASDALISLYGTYSAPQNAGPGEIFGMYGNVTQPQNAAGTTSILVGTYDSPKNSAGTSTALVGSYVNPQVSGGSVPDVYGFYATPFVTAGTVSNYYGMYLAAGTLSGVSNKYGLYQEDTTAKNVFAGTVSIGTTTPSLGRLTVASTTGPQLSLSAGVGVSQWAFRNAGGNLYLATTTVAGTATTSTSALSINGTTGALSLNSGVLAATPNALLDFGSYYDSGGNVSVSHINLYGGTYGFGVSAGFVNYIAGSSGGHAFYTNGGLATPSMVLASGGNVGIGSTTPFAKLSVQASTAQTNPVFEVASSSNATKFLTVSGTGFGTTTLSGLTISGSATSTSNVGFNLSAGCYAVNGTCLSSGSSLTGTEGQLAYFSGTDTAVGTSTLFLSTAGNLGIGTSTPRGRLSLYSSTTASSIVGLEQFHTFNISDGGTSFANYMDITNAPVGSANTLAGSIIRLRDNTALANTVRGLEIQTNQGSNTQGENTALSAFGRTFGVRAVTEGDAGGVLVPTGLYAETRGTTQGNAIRAYSSSVTSADALVSILHDTSTFSGTGLLMNLANGSGSATGNLLDLQVNDASKFLVTSSSTVGIATSTPWGKLSVNSTAGIPQFVIGSSTTQFIVDQNGYVGIGTTSPVKKFSVSDPIYVGGSGVTATSTFEGNLHVRGTLMAGTGSVYISETGVRTTGASAFDFSNTTGTALSISQTGFGTTTLSGLNIDGQATSTSNVGFNITGGCYAVNGTCLSSGSSLTGTTGQVAYFSGTNTAAGTSTLFLSTASNVGIGTTNPNYTLDVNGDVNVASGKCFRMNGVCIGYVKRLAGIYSNSTASSNQTVTFGANHTPAGAFTGSLILPASTTEMIVEVWGSGGGGAGGSNGGSAGNSSCFGTNATACTSPLLSATGGSGGGSSGAGGAGGSGSSGDINMTGESGDSVFGSVGAGGTGGSAPRGGGGGTGVGSGTASNGNAFGGGGGGTGEFTTQSGGGGGGGYSLKRIAATSAFTVTHYYTVGAAGAKGGNGGNGGAGGIVITVYATSSPTASGNDYAEMFPVSSPGITAGDIVSIDAGVPVSMKLAAQGDRALAGVISTEPGHTLGDITASGMRPVALAGRVPVKVLTTETFKIGDRVAPSHVPGVGRKAGPFDDSVGIVIAPVEHGEKGDTVMIFLDLQRGIDINAIALGLLGDEIFASIASPTSASSSNASTSVATVPLDFVGGMMKAIGSRIAALSPFESTATTTASTTEIVATSTPFDTYADGFIQSLFAHVTSWFAYAGNGIKQLFAEELIAKRVAADEITANQKLCVGETCITEAELIELLDRSGVSAAPVTEPDHASEPTPEPSATSSATTSAPPSGGSETPINPPPAEEPAQESAAPQESSITEPVAEMPNAEAPAEEAATADEPASEPAPTESAPAPEPESTTPADASQE